MKKSNYVLIWKDCGKTCYKVFLCTLAEINFHYDMKKKVFPNVRMEIQK